MRKITSCLLLGLLFLSLLSACENTNKEAGRSTAGKVKIEFFHYKREAIGTFDQLIKKFEQENPNIQVVQVSPAEAEMVLKTRIAKQDVPDIVGIGANNNFAVMSQAGLFTDLTNAPELKNIQPGYVEIINNVTGLKQLYAIPYTSNADGVIYNKALFKELGLEVPKTWDEFITVCDKIKAAGKTPFYFTLKDAWTTLPAFNALAANTQGENFFQKRIAEQTTFEQSYQEAAEKYRRLLEYGQNDKYGKTYNDGNAAFAKGESVMYLQGIWAITEIKKANPNIELGVFPYPATNDFANTKLVSGVDLLLSIAKSSKHPEEARKFVNFLLDPQNAKAYIAEQKAFSAVKGVVQDDPNDEGLQPIFAKGMLVDFPDHYFPTGVPLDRLLQEFTQKLDVADFLKKLDIEWNRVQKR